MAVKKAVAKKAKKAPAKKAVARRRKTRAGESLMCGVCGLTVTVDEECGCMETHDIICCERPMKKKRSKK